MAEPTELLSHAAEIVAAYVGNNNVRAEEVPELIRTIHRALAGRTEPAEEVPEAEPAKKLTPAQVRRSITPDGLVSFIDGKSYKTLKKHLSRHGLDLAGYRERYGLPKDYPSVAPAYSARRSELAKSLGLGRKAGSATAAEPVAEPAPSAPAEAAGTEETAPAATPARRRRAAAPAAPAED